MSFLHTSINEQAIDETTHHVILSPSINEQAIDETTHHVIPSHQYV